MREDDGAKKRAGDKFCRNTSYHGQMQGKVLLSQCIKGVSIKSSLSSLASQKGTNLASPWSQICSAVQGPFPTLH